MRKPLQGLRNVVWFNWPYYLVSAFLLLLLAVGARWFDGWIGASLLVFLALAIAMILGSLAVTLYVYDLSGFYKLNWLDDFSVGDGDIIFNISAGFDETSALLKSRFPGAKLTACDFYDPKRHTEASIKRARAAYPPFPGTLHVRTDTLPCDDYSIDRIFLIMSAHEIRDADERRCFFNELERAMSSAGRLVVVEHLRDMANLCAYNIGALHFHSRSEWINCFRSANLQIECEKELTPFIKAFFVKKNGTAH